ncbi:MAG: sacsin N-terminal ATP-binding-like domain-containing protein, partial [Ginsengibacter sp.]
MSRLQEFIKDQLDKRKQDYLSSPEYLIEHYNSEKENVEAYNKRQLLEMLQNADDASETARDKKVLIRLSDHQLIIANNGEPFNEEGIRSIIYSHISPKSEQLNKIGHKGLGFRSILSWAEEVTIQSGGASLAFSETIARDFLKRLFKDSPKTEQIIRNRTKVKFPIATLRIPKLLDAEANVDELYDTVISIHLKPSIVDDVQQQILTIINKETLVFLNHLETIEIESPSQNIIYRKNYENEKRTIVTVESICPSDNGVESRSWNIRRKTGMHKNKNYELAIAWNKDLDDSENELFSYFKTEVSFPFPALVHGTFELSPDRKKLNDDTEGHNKFLVGELSGLLIESALEIASGRTKADFGPLKLLNIDFDAIDTVLKGFNFKEMLLQRIKESCLFPSVNGNYFPYSNQPVYYSYPVSDLLSGDDVKDLMPHCDEPSLVSFLRNLTVFHYEFETFISIIAVRLTAISHASLSRLYYHLLTYPAYQERIMEGLSIEKLPLLLLDASNYPIPWDAHIFLQPDSNKVFLLPETINVRFVNPTVIQHLLNEFKNPDIDFVADKLKPFEVKKYSFSEVAQAMIQHYGAKKEITPAEIKDLHQHLFDVFQREDRGKALVPELPSELMVPAISLNGKPGDTRKMYLGSDYGYLLMEKLFSFDKSVILALPESFGLGNEQLDDVINYFKWLGVAVLPRYSLVELPTTTTDYSIYKEHLLRNYDYRKLTDYGEKYAGYDQLARDLFRVPSIVVGCFDRMEKILSSVKPEIIFEWIKKDPRLKKTLEEDIETLPGALARLDIRGTRFLRTIRGSNFPSYTRWLFANSPWLPTERGNKKVSPEKCCLSKTITSEFSPFVEKPALNISKIADFLDIPESTVENYLVIAGVHREISSFSVGSLYDMLLALPRTDKEGEKARRIYREIISNFDEKKVDINHPSYHTFITEGEIFCQEGSVFGYRKVTEVYYLPSKTYGSNVLKLFPLAEIDSKQGTQKIEKLFGVTRLKGIRFDIARTPVISPLNHEFSNEIERFKALVYVLRMSRDTRHEILNRLKRAKINLVVELVATFTHNGVTKDYEAEFFDYIETGKRNSFYISVPTGLRSLSELRDSDQFCQSISEIFTSLIETEEYKDFIHDLYSRPEYKREPRILFFLGREDNADIRQARSKLDISDDIRLLFWRAFSLAAGKSLNARIIGEHELLEFLTTKLKLDRERIRIFSSEDFYSDPGEMPNLEQLYHLFTEYDADPQIFARHFSGIDFSILFTNKLEDLKNQYSDEFSWQLYRYLSSRSLEEKVTYFDKRDAYDDLEYNPSDGFLKDISSYFLSKIEQSFSITLKNEPVSFSCDHNIEESLSLLRSKKVVIPAPLLIQ